MGSNCQDYERVGYCLKGRECGQRHGDDHIELDVAGYEGLIEAKQAALSAAAAQTREQQNELARKQTDLLSNLVSQQRALIQRIESCSDEAEKLRLKTVLNEMSQKTKEWIEQGGTSRSRLSCPNSANVAQSNAVDTAATTNQQSAPNKITTTVLPAEPFSKEM
jgi:hypothetical protein